MPIYVSIVEYTYCIFIKAPRMKIGPKTFYQNDNRENDLEQNDILRNDIYQNDD